MRIRAWSSLVASILLTSVLVPCAVQGGDYIFDDFTDGSAVDGQPATWKISVEPWDRGSFAVDAATESLVITPATSGVTSISNYWETDIYIADQLYRDMIMRTTVRGLGQGDTVVGVGGRDTEVVDGPSGAGVWGMLLFDGATRNLQLNHGAGEGGPFGTQSTSLSHLTGDVNLEYALVGSTVSFTAWEAGTPKPQYPSIMRVIPEELWDDEGHAILFAGNRSTSVPIAFRSVEVNPDPYKESTLFLLPAAEYTVRDSAADGPTDGVGDAVGLVSSTIVRVGEQDLTTAAYLERAITKFQIPTGSDLSQKIQRATLRYYMGSVVDPTGALSVLHSTSDNDLERVASDYENTTYIDTGRDLATATDSNGRYYEFDVTEQLMADLANDGANPIMAFRLQMDDVTFIENDSNRQFRLNGVAGSNKPMLVLTMVPEPSTAWLALTALALVAKRKARRR